MANIYTKSMRDALQEARDYREPEELTEKIKAGKGKVSVLVKSEPPDDFRGDEKSYSKAMKKLYNITIKSNPRTGISQVSGEKSDILKYLQSYDYGIHDPDIEKFWPELLESHIEEVKEHLSYDEWLKEEKGIKEGAHGINSDEHAKYSTEWKNYVTEIVGGRGEMTVTKDGGVMIIKTKDWQTYKAKGWVKREEGENESLELPATGAITSNSTGQEDESEELDEASRLRPIKGLYTMAQMKKQVARTEKAFKEFEQHCDFIFQMDADIGPSMGDNSGKYWNVHKVLDNANNQIKKALADAKRIT